MMQFIKQHKGKALEKISPRSLIRDDRYYISIKHDGRMNQIAYDGKDTVKFWTGGGHEFYNEAVAKEIIKNNTIAFHIEAEFTGNSRGLLGDRGKSGVETKFRTAFNKGLASPNISDLFFWVFDILSFDNEDVRQDSFEDRLAMMMQLTYSYSFKEIEQIAGYTIEMGMSLLQDYLDTGYEGIILTHATHTIDVGGRSNLRIKLKETPTDYGTIVGWVPGTKDREGTIGSLTIKDDDGFEFSSGTGLNSEEWNLDPELLIGKRIKFGYESILKGVYQQPRYLGAVLEDKTLVRLNEVI